MNENNTHWDEHLLTHDFVCLSHNIQGNHQTHTISTRLWPLPFDANRIHVAHEQFTSQPKFSPSCILTSCMVKLEHLDEPHQEVVD